MNKFLTTNLRVALAALAIASMASCSDDSDDIEPSQVYRRVITFEAPDCKAIVAGPTSYGANLYADFDGSKFTTGSITISNDVTFDFGINKDATTGAYNFWNGGAVVSNWNIRSNSAAQTDGWWYSYENQCSVYNEESTDGANKGAGAGGSNNFLLINGFSDDKNNYAPSISFSNNREYLVENVMYCPTSYLYGTIVNGNPFGNNPGQSLEQANGWFKITVTGYDAQGNPTRTLEKMICDYRDNTKPQAIVGKWQNWDLSALGRVNKLTFNFQGSDAGPYGLSTPAYMALDNFTLRLN